MPIFYFRFQAHPKATSGKAADTGGAFINCWIQRDTAEEAESYARGAIADEDWAISRLEESFAVTRETQDPPALRYFAQAEIDGEVFVFHTWPVGAQDGGTSTV